VVDNAKIVKAVESITNKYGKNSIYIASKPGALKPMEFAPTGLVEVDRMLGGGLPKSKIVMCYGPEGAGKTSFAYHMLAKYQNQGQIAAYINAEKAYDQKRADAFGVDPNKILIADNETGEQALSMVIELATAEIPLIIVDSVAALVPRKEFELESETDKFAGIALTAGLLARKLPAVNNICYRTGTTVLFINQVRDNMNTFGYGQPQEVVPGGRAIKHISHVIFKIVKKSTLKVSDQKVGMILRFVTGIKNRSASPFQEVDVPFIFTKGFSTMETYKKDMKEVRRAYLAETRGSTRQFIDDSSDELLHEEEENI
jgi:recombination protein RecA